MLNVEWYSVESIGKRVLREGNKIYEGERLIDLWFKFGYLENK